MSFLDVFLGLKSHSPYQVLLSREEIDDLVSVSAISSLTGTEEKGVERAIEARRGSDGRISLAQVDETLRKLEKEKQISVNDREALMKVFERYFQKKLGSRP